MDFFIRKGILESFLKNGITVVRVMSETYGIGHLMGFPNILIWKEDIKIGKIRGPRIIAGSPILDGKPRTSPAMMEVTNPKKVDKIVRDWKEKGYDFLKIYENLSYDVYKAIVESSQLQRIPFAGHVPIDVGLEEAINDGIWSIEHLTGYYNNDLAKMVISGTEFRKILQNPKTKKVYHVPTLVAIANLQKKENFSSYLQNEENKNLDFRMRFHWYMTHKGFYENAKLAIQKWGEENYQSKVLQDLKNLTRALYNAGIPILPGTDANFVGVIPGKSFHQELVLLSEAGIPASEVLYLATIETRKALKVFNRMDTEFLDNDWILLEKNPIQNIQNSHSILITIQNGRIVWKKE